MSKTNHIVVMVIFSCLSKLHEISVAVIFFPFQQLEIVARDLGSPQLSTTSTASVSVERPGVEPIAPKTWATFSDTEYNAEVKEDTAVGTLVHKLTILNKPDLVGHLRCSILDGNSDGKDI